MPSPGQSETTSQSPGMAMPVTRSSEPGQAALAPIPQPVSAAENPAPAPAGSAATPPGASPAEAKGRRTLSTAFVRVGPDRLLTVELTSGRVLVLRDVVMGARHFQGMQVRGRSPAAKYRGGYADVAAARPGGAPAAD